MFPLAIVGYAGLTATAVLSARGRVPIALWRATAAIIVAHVVLVWAVRYEWSLATATRNGYAGFLIFHAALALVIASVFLRERAASLIGLAFCIVTAGALGAVFRYAEVAAYRPVVIVLAAAGAIGLPYGWYWARPPREG
jgi:hypothetical protein